MGFEIKMKVPLSVTRLMFTMQLLTLLSPVLFAVDPNCNYYQKMEVGVTYYIYNREYPGNYGPSANCLWRAVAPEGYKIETNCDLNIPPTESCYQDKLFISLVGNPNLENAYTYCGSGSTGSLMTEANSISMGLQSAYYTQGGRFLCTIVAKEISKPCNCGWKNTRRIVGGVETKMNEYPMMAALMDFASQDWFCGCTIISEQYVLTAAHCLNKITPDITGVLVGSHNITAGNATGTVDLLRAMNFILHKEYDPNDIKGVNDIALVKTERKISFNNVVGPACLPFRQTSNSFAGDTVEALGWGTTEFTGPKSEVLLKTDLQVLDYYECYTREGGTILQMCSYKAGHDSCQSDSGGPLLWLDQNSYRINVIGVISTGYGCATTHAGLNTRITQYLEWIQKNTPEVQYCVL